MEETIRASVWIPDGSWPADLAEFVFESVEQTVEQPIEKSVEQSVEKSIEQQMFEQMFEQLVERLVEQPVEQPLTSAFAVAPARTEIASAQRTLESAKSKSIALRHSR